MPRKSEMERFGLLYVIESTCDKMMPLRQSEMGFSPLAVSYRKGERRVLDKVDRKKIGHVFGETDLVTIRK